MKREISETGLKLVRKSLLYRLMVIGFWVGYVPVFILSGVISNSFILRFILIVLYSVVFVQVSEKVRENIENKVRYHLLIVQSGSRWRTKFRKMRKIASNETETLYFNKIKIESKQSSGILRTSDIFSLGRSQTISGKAGHIEPFSMNEPLHFTSERGLEDEYVKFVSANLRHLVYQFPGLDYNDWKKVMTPGYEMRLGDWLSTIDPHSVTEGYINANNFAVLEVTPASKIQPPTVNLWLISKRTMREDEETTKRLFALFSKPSE